MNQETTPKSLFLQSVERCETNPGFIPAFYDRFLGQSEVVREKFAETDFNQQNRMLLRSLKLSAGAIAGEQPALQELTQRAESHNRHNLDIQPELYDLWLDAIIKTAREFDEQWNEEIETAWRDILHSVIHHMAKRY